MKKLLQKLGIIFLIGFLVYMAMEIIFGTIFAPFESKSFIGLFSMGILGGFLLMGLGSLNEVPMFLSGKVPIVLQAVIGGILITLAELGTGYIVNILLGWNVWDYSDLPLSFFNGQICLIFTFMWILLAPFAYWLDDLIRDWIDKIWHDFTLHYIVSEESWYLKNSYKRMFTLK